MFGIGMPELVVIFIILAIPIAGILIFVSISSRSRRKKIAGNASNETPGSISRDCIKCGEKIPAGSSFCPNCGEKLAAETSGIHASSGSLVLTRDDYAAFVGRNSETYLAKFRKFNIAGVDIYKVTWHWPAFFVPFWWLLYRKMYGWAVAAFLLGIIPYIGLLFHLVWAMTANYLYYKHARKNLLEIKQTHPDPATQKAVMVVTGGVVAAAVLVGAIIGFIVLIGILAAIAVPQYESYRKRTYHEKIRLDLGKDLKARPAIHIKL